MNKNGASPLQRGEENDTVVEGDKGEQLIANVLLAVMVSQLCSDAAAKGYIDRAYALAEALARQSVTYRPSQPSKFARLTFDVDHQVETLLVSVINGVLIVPRISSLEGKASSLSSRHTIKLADIELVRFILRIRTRRIVAALESLRTRKEDLCQTAQYIIAECLRHEAHLGEPLDRVSDCFTLAHDLVGKRNYPFAALLLNKAAGALDVFLSSTQIAPHHALAHSMKDEIGLLLKGMKQTAA